MFNTKNIKKQFNKTISKIEKLSVRGRKGLKVLYKRGLKSLKSLKNRLGN